MDEETGVGGGWFEVQLCHATTEVLVEQFGAVSLTVQALLKLENNIFGFTSFGSIILWQFHVHFSGLGTLAKCKREVDLSGFPTMGGSQQQSGSNGGPSNQRGIGIFVQVGVQISTVTNTAFEFVQSSIRVTFDSLNPCGRHNLGAGWDIARSVTVQVPFSSRLSISVSIAAQNSSEC